MILMYVLIPSSVVKVVAPKTLLIYCLGVGTLCLLAARIAGRFIPEDPMELAT